MSEGRWEFGRSRESVYETVTEKPVLLKVSKTSDLSFCKKPKSDFVRNKSLGINPYREFINQRTTERPLVPTSELLRGETYIRRND